MRAGVGLWAGLCGLLLLTACDKRPEPAHAERPVTEAAAPDTTHATESVAIDWYPGPVQDALAEASRSGRPVLLYWGAKWCPPCNHLKATLFHDPGFVALTRRFVAVYLDGDSDGAQRWGDHFAISGYPTLITLGPDGTERLRLDGGMAPDRYPAVLEAASRQEQPVSVLREQALAGKLPADADGWQLLDAHDWLMEPGVDADEQIKRLDGLAAAAPQPGMRQRFALLAACLHVMKQRPMSSDEQGRVRELLGGLLANPVAVRRNLGELQYLGVDLLKATAATAPLKDALADVLRTAADDTSLSPAGRLESGFGLIELAGKPVPAAMQNDWRERVKRELAADGNAHERVALVNSGYQLLDALGLESEAEALLKAELARTAEPYYFMADLAELAEARGDSKAALDWLDRAWQQSEGPATRLQWGTNYLRGVLRMAPDDIEHIQSLGLKLADEVDATPDAWFQRSRMRMQRLGTALRQWATDVPRQALLQRLQTRLQQGCDALEGGKDAGKALDACRRWPEA